MEDRYTQSDGSTTLNFSSCRNAIEKLKEFEIDRNINRSEDANIQRVGGCNPCMQVAELMKI